MKNSIFILVFLFFTHYLHLNAQVTQQWVARYNGPGNGVDQAHSMAVDASGNVYVTGQSMGIGSNFDYSTIKYNTSGVQQWVSRYNGPGNGTDVATSIAIDGSGNVYVTGYSVGNGTGPDYATIKYNSSGAQQWVSRYNDSRNGYDEAVSVKVDGLGNVYVTGTSSDSINLSVIATVKYNSSGVQQWVARYNNYLGQAVGLVVDGAGNVYVTGNVFLSTGKFATVKYNPSGIQQWAEIYPDPGNNEYVTGIALDGAGNVYVSGYYWISGYQFATLKYNTSGTEVWVQGAHGGFTTGITIDNSANVYVIGGAGTGSGNDYVVQKFDSTGNLHWTSSYNGPASSNDVPQSVTVDASGNVYVTGESGGIGTNYDYATVKYNSSGVQQWVQRYNGPGDSVDFATSVAVDGSGNVYVTGYSTGSGTSYDYATIKYSQPNGIVPISSNVPKEYGLSQNYPNPFNPSTKIKFDIPVAGTASQTVRLIIYDILGREVATLVNEPLRSGTYEVTFDGTNLTSGLYFYKLTSGAFTETKKMVLVK